MNPSRYFRVPARWREDTVSSRPRLPVADHLTESLSRGFSLIPFDLSPYIAVRALDTEASPSCSQKRFSLRKRRRYRRPHPLLAIP
jgi:hypothetical protein